MSTRILRKSILPNQTKPVSAKKAGLDPTSRLDEAVTYEKAGTEEESETLKCAWDSCGCIIYIYCDVYDDKLCRHHMCGQVIPGA